MAVAMKEDLKNYLN